MDIKHLALCLVHEKYDQKCFVNCVEFEKRERNSSFPFKYLQQNSDPLSHLAGNKGSYTPWRKKLQKPLSLDLVAKMLSTWFHSYFYAVPQTLTPTCNRGNVYASPLCPKQSLPWALYFYSWYHHSLSHPGSSPWYSFYFFLPILL